MEDQVKTQIIRAIQEYFLRTGKQQKLRVIAYTANATSLINGTMINSLLGLSISKHTTISKPNSIINIWPNIQFIIINEISMVGCTLLVTIHLKLQKLKSNILPFGGINIMFMTDILQFPPIIDTPLYSSNMQSIFTFTKLTWKKVIGKSLWENYIGPNSIILTKQMKQNKDIQYATLLESLQTRNILKSNFDLPKTHFLSNLNVNLFNDPWRIAIFIIPCNDYKMA
jgi:hypothetical protein